MKNWLFVFLGAAALLGATESTHEDRIATSITIYNRDLALVSEIRQVELTKGIGSFYIQDFCDTIQPDSVLLQKRSGPGDVRLHEQSYEPATANAQRLLEAFEGKEIKLVQWNEYQDRKDEATATLISAQGGGIFQVEGEVYLGHPGFKVLPSLPEGLTTQDSLHWLMHCTQKGEYALQLNYLANGFSWEADYHLTLRDNEADLSGWVTVENRSNQSFRASAIALVAGEPNRVAESGGAPGMLYKATRSMADASMELQQEPMSAYHLFRLERLTTLNAHERKQLPLLPKKTIPIERVYRVDGGQLNTTSQLPGDPSSLPVKLYLQFVNSERGGLGSPLPAGVVRLFQEDGQGEVRFVGEDRIAHTAEDEQVRLATGTVFDLVANRRQTSYKRITAKMHESSWETALRNRSDQAQTIEIIERLYGTWQISETNYPYVKLDANTVRFSIPVEPGMEKKLKYTVRVGF